MAIRAVDMALPVQRGTELNQNMRGEHRPEVQAQQFAERINKEANRQEQQVQQTPRGEEASIQKDGRGNSGGYQGNRGKKKKQDGQAVSQPKKASDSLFDLSV
jgi:hypothetical protein